MEYRESSENTQIEANQFNPINSLFFSSQQTVTNKSYLETFSNSFDVSSSCSTFLKAKDQAKDEFDQIMI